MEIKQRVKDMLINPLTTWQTIANENTGTTYLINMYLMPLLLLGSLATFLGFGIIGNGSSLQQGFTNALSYFINNVAGIMLLTITVIKLAPGFTSALNFNAALQLIIYSFTPALAGSVINILPSLTWMNTIFSLYGIYLLYLGLPLILKTPEDKRSGFTLAIVICTLLIYSILGMITNKLLNTGFGISYNL